SLTQFIGAYYQIDHGGTQVDTKVAIYASNGSAPSGPAIGVSIEAGVDDSGTGDFADREFYAFDFTTPVTLAANTEYYLAPVNDSNTTGAFAWYFSTDGDASEANSSGWTFTRINNRSPSQTGTNNTGAWSAGNGGAVSTAYTAAFVATYSGGAAVPEPTMTSLLCLGGIALIRRRMKK
ncbi:MAG: PEP-CTERM sorting domain-containing protein, partial [Pirellula sp.]